MRSIHILAAVLAVAACSKDATGPTHSPLAGTYAISQYYDSLNGGWSAATGSLTTSTLSP